MTTECRFPSLAEPYATALSEAIAFILERFEVRGIVASGTIVRGNPGPSSDLDLYVVHAPAWRQRVQRFFNRVPAEIFVNPQPQVLRYFEGEARDGRPLTAHMLATGFVVLDRDGVIAQLQADAASWLAKPPAYGGFARTMQPYLLASQFEDACDMVESDPDSARLILAPAVRGMLHYAFMRAERYIPRDKDLLVALEGLDPVLAHLAREYFATPGLAAQMALAGQIADRTIEARGFFEWESVPEDVQG